MSIEMNRIGNTVIFFTLRAFKRYMKDKVVVNLESIGLRTQHNHKRDRSEFESFCNYYEDSYTLDEVESLINKTKKSLNNDTLAVIIEVIE